MSAVSTVVELEDLLPYCGLCCFIASCYIEKPLCLGCLFNNTVLCISHQMVVLKPHADEDVCVTLFGTECNLIPVKVCCKSKSQVCCLDCRLSLPPEDRDVPCMLNFCGATLFLEDRFTCRCCEKIRSMREVIPAAVPVPTAPPA